MDNYSPFPNQKLSELKADDLIELKTVSEGWYVEYKRELTNPKAIAKSISSFANTYGGWLFFGVEQKPKPENSAQGCPGIAKSELDAALQKINQGVASHLSPAPFYDLKVIEGPDDAVGLLKGYVVICIHVPMSRRAPHVHSSGCIYRRVADTSDPSEPRRVCRRLICLSYAAMSDLSRAA